MLGWRLTRGNRATARGLTTIAAIVGTGFLFLLVNLHLPIVRNSFVYAKTAINLIDHGFNPLPVIADVSLSYGKPIAFSVLSAPLVSVVGPNAGVKFASFLGTVFFLWMACLFFMRLNARAGIDPRVLPLELALLFLNPLASYQFWSAYPDSLFAGEVLLAFVLTDVIVSEGERDTRGLILLLGLVIYAAILTKFYGLILGIAVPAYLLLNLRSFLQPSEHRRSKAVLLGFVFCVLGAAVLLARLGKNPSLDFAVAAYMGGGYGGYMSGLTDPGGAVLDSAIMFVFAIALNFHLALLFLLRRNSVRAVPLAPAAFGGIYLLGLLPFSGTSYNMRFFLPLFPFLVVAIVAGILGTKTAPRRVLFSAYVLTASFLILNYNVEPFHARFPAFSDWLAGTVSEKRRPLDNLRLEQHLAFASRIHEMNATIERAGVLVWTSSYYGASTHGLIGDLGLREDIVVRYAYSSADIPPVERPVYVAGYASRSSRSQLEERFAVTPLGSGLYRIVPLRVELTGPAGDHFKVAEPIPLMAHAFVSAEADVAELVLSVNDAPVAAGTENVLEYVWQGTEEGRHVITARLRDSGGNVAESAPRTIFVGVRALERYVRRSADDAEQVTDGFVVLRSTDLDLMEDQEEVGLRFTDIRVSRGAGIRRAYLQFTADEVSAERTELTVRAELTGDAAVFDHTGSNLSSRERTSASVSWLPEPWEVEGESSPTQRTPDLSPLIEEVIAHPEWREGNSIVLLIEGSGRRVAISWDGSRQNAPRLFMELR